MEPQKRRCFCPHCGSAVEKWESSSAVRGAGGQLRPADGASFSDVRASRLVEGRTGAYFLRSNALVYRPVMD